jgi:hypothetical protein
MYKFWQLKSIGQNPFLKPIQDDKNQFIISYGLCFGEQAYETIDELMSFKKDTFKCRIGFYHG